MEAEYTQLSDTAPSRRAILRVFLSLMILIPLLLSGIIRLAMSDWELGEILAYFSDSWNGGFWSVDCDSTFYYTVLADNGGLLGLLFGLHGLVCAAAGIALMGVTIKRKLKSLLPFAIPCCVFGALMLLTVLGDMTLAEAYGRYCLPQLWGYNIRLLHGAAPVVMYSLMAAGYGVYLYLDMRQCKADNIDNFPS